MAIDARIRGDLEKVLLSDPLDSRARPRGSRNNKSHASCTRPFHMPPLPRAYCTAEWITTPV
jgi:hypothetical protein